MRELNHEMSNLEKKVDWMLHLLSQEHFDFAQHEAQCILEIAPDNYDAYLVLFLISVHSTSLKDYFSKTAVASLKCSECGLKAITNKSWESMWKYYHKL